MKYVKDDSWQDEINDFATDILEERSVERGRIHDAKDHGLVFKFIHRRRLEEALWHCCLTVVQLRHWKSAMKSVDEIYRNSADFKSFAANYFIHLANLLQLVDLEKLDLFS